MDDQFSLEIKGKMVRAFEVTKNDRGTVRTGRATPALVEHIEITAYGGSQKLKLREMATITTIDSKSLVIHPFDPTTHEDIIKSISEANTGLNPVADGNEIRINIPPLSADRRQEYVKLVHAKLEAGRIMIRQIRHEEMADLKRDFEAKLVTEDDKKHYEKIIQQITDEMIAEIDRLGELKEKELMQI